MEEGRDGRRLRIGVMLDALTVRNWEALILRQIEAAAFCDLALFIVNAERRPKRSLSERVRSNRSLAAFKLYTRLDRRLFGRDDDAFAPVDLLDEFAAVPRLSTVPLSPTRFEHRLDAAAITAIEAAELDVILRFGFKIIRGAILEAARYGVWSFHHGDNDHYRGTPPFFWEMYEGNPVCGTILQRLTEELDGGGVLYRSWSTTDPVSLRRGRNRAFWKSSHFVIRRLHDLHARGWEEIARSEGYTRTSRYDKPIYRTPTNRQTLRLVSCIIRGIAARRLRRLVTREQWCIAYRRRRAGPPLSPSSLDGFTIVDPPADRYYADPFLVADGGRDHVLFEDYRYATGKGHISGLTLGGADRRPEAYPVLKCDHHLSYPFTFEVDGVAYMIPESSAAGRIDLYRAERVPDRWVHERVLMDGVDAADTTIFAHEGRLWMFTAIAVAGAAPTDELFLFWAASLDGEWTAHPKSPIVSDVRCARPAGRVFRDDGVIYRPAQDCSARYGSAVVLHRIDVLTTTEYRETPVGRLGEGWAPGVLATHTYEVGEHHEVIDGLRRRSRLQRPRRARSYRSR